MTKEELKQEAEEWLCNNLHSASEEDFIKAMVDIAEPREKQIERLSKEIDDLENMKATFESRIAKLEAQIEKMKCCYNCANDTLEPPEVIGNGICEHCKNHDKWELQY